MRTTTTIAGSSLRPASTRRAQPAVSSSRARRGGLAALACGALVALAEIVMVAADAFEAVADAVILHLSA
jgi:hypothetical protein